MMLPSLPTFDIAVFAVFLACWLGYVRLANLIDGTRPTLMTAVSRFRTRWIERIGERDSHIADAAFLGNLLRGALFFASTTVFILGGLGALLGAAPKATELISWLPHTSSAEAWLAEVKVFTLILVFVYAFFKFTWSAWQYNVLSIMVGAMPKASQTAEHKDYTDAAAAVAVLAGESYNNGIRAYYFSIPLMAWLIDPVLFLVSTLAVTAVLYRREFTSPTLAALSKVRI